MAAVSHWHDDHVKGVDEILKNAPNAPLVCSAALRCSEFQSVLAASAFGGSPPSPVDAMRRAFEVLSSRPPESPRVSWAIENKVLFKNATATVTALSPSDAQFTRALSQFEGIIPKAGTTRGSVPNHSANEYSIVLHIDFADFSFLLGGDLELAKSRSRGWHAVCDSSLRPAARACVYKVAHHGSDNADTGCIWEDLLDHAPHAIVAPFGRLQHPRPTPVDLQRINSTAGSVHLTANPAGRKVKPPSHIRRPIRSTARTMKKYDKMGQVRWRSSVSNSEPMLEHFGAAYALPL